MSRKARTPSRPYTVVDMTGKAVLTFACVNRAGIVAAVTTALFEDGFNILEAQQFDDTQSDRFFMRVVFDAVRTDATLERYRSDFATLAARFAMRWTLRDLARPRRVAILVSRFDHCLADLLYRARMGELPMTIVAIVANHPRETYAHLAFGEIPFHYLPVTPATKSAQEARVLEIVAETQAEVVVLARYMQILGDGIARALAGRCINIHYSFLPGFKGANPYRQAYERDVKLIGATAHDVTADLDETRSSNRIPNGSIAAIRPRRSRANDAISNDAFWRQRRANRRLLAAGH